MLFLRYASKFIEAFVSMKEVVANYGNWI